MGMFDEPTLGIPGISFKGARKGLTITGTLLPQLQKGSPEPVSYRKVQDTDRNGNPRVFPSGDPIYRIEFLLQTELRDWAQTSAEFEQRHDDEFPDEKDTGLRRWIAGSAYATKSLRAAFKAHKGVDPEVGAQFTIKVTGTESGTIQSGPNAGEKYTTPNLEIDWAEPTPAGRALAEKYREEHLQTAPAEGSGAMFDGGDEAPF